MLYVLVILSCSVQQGCTKQVAAEGFGMMGCLSQSQTIAAQWQKEHPKHKIQQLRCVDHRRLPFELNRDSI